MFKFFFCLADLRSGTFHKIRLITDAVYIFLHPAGHLHQLCKRGIVCPYPFINLGYGLGFLGKLFLAKFMNMLQELRRGFSFHFQMNAKIFYRGGFFFRIGGNVFLALAGVFTHLVKRTVVPVKEPVENERQGNNAQGYEVSAAK